MPEFIAIFSVGAADQVYNQTNEFVYLGGNINHNADLSIEVDRRIRNAWCSFRKYTLELYDRPSASLELKLLMLRAEVPETMLYTMLYVCVVWSPRACHYDMLRRTHHSFLTRCIGWRENKRTDHPTSYLGTLMKTGNESIAAIMRRRRVLFAGFVARVEDTKLPKCVMIGEPVGARAARGARKRVDGASPGPPQRFRYQRRPVDDYSPGRWGMAQDGGTRGGTLERDGKDQGEGSPNKRVHIGSPAIADRPQVARTCILRPFFVAVFFWRYVCFVLFRFRLFVFIESRALRSIDLLYSMHAPDSQKQLSHNCCVLLCFVPLCFFGDVAFSEYFVPLPFHFVWRVPYVFSFRMGFFYRVTTG